MARDVLLGIFVGTRLSEVRSGCSVDDRKYPRRFGSVNTAVKFFIYLLIENMVSKVSLSQVFNALTLASRGEVYGGCYVTVRQEHLI